MSEGKILAFRILFPDLGILLNPNPDPGCFWIQIQSGSRPRYVTNYKNRKLGKILINDHHICLLKPLQRTFRVSKHEISKFFPMFLGTILACLESGSGSRSADPIESGSYSDPDPKHWNVAVFEKASGDLWTDGACCFQPSPSMCVSARPTAGQPSQVRDRGWKIDR